MPSLEEILVERFSLKEFRPWQREAIVELLEGSGQALVIAPTGGGKSLCYQFPATVLEGTTVVISPLIALMEDQVRALEANGIAATFLASTLDPREREQREEAIANGEFDLVYLAPERLTSARMLNLLVRLSPSLVAIDEAHCISQWGHDFRPSYLQLGDLIKELGAPRVLACTATATPLVRDEIVERLGLQSAKLVLRGFSRPNLSLSALEVGSAAHRNRLVLESLTDALESSSTPTGAAIIYAATRKNTEKVTDLLKKKGWRVAAYHAGLSASVREEVNRRFAIGKLDVVVATNAFGMGIDRSDIRTVIHVQPPGSVEAYYQEVGRGGRDGQPATGVLLSSSGDFGLRRRLIGLSEDPGYGNGNGKDEGRDSQQVQRQWQLFLDLMSYIEAGSCRHDFILNYFGDEVETLGGCGHCDVCKRLEASGEDGEARQVSEEDAVIVQKALAGIARNNGRAGLTAVADMLYGADTERLRSLGLTSLSTHGLLKAHPKPWVLALLRRLLTARLIDLSATEFPVPFLTKDGVAVMQGHAPVQVLLPHPEAGQNKKPKNTTRARKADAPLLSTGDENVFERLRFARHKFAKQKGVPAFIICHDRTLVEIATQRPTTIDQLGEVFGMGPARIENYGSGFLEVIQGS